MVGVSEGLTKNLLTLLILLISGDNMARNMTMALPDKTFEVMKKHPEIKWTEIARQAIQKKIIELEIEKDPLRKYAYKRWLEEGEDAEKLFEF